MKKWIFTLAFCCFIQPLSGQSDVELFGYFESQLIGGVVRNKFIQLQSNKLRVDLKSKGSDHVSFGANFDYITYHGKTSWNILDYLPDQIISTVPPEFRDYYILSFDDRIFLDNGYIRLSFKYADLTVGKQQIALGTGYVWNPTDLFNIKDLLDPTYEQPGHNAFRLDFALTTRYTMTALYAVGDEWNNSDKMLLFKGRIAHFDYSFIGIEKEWIYYDYTRFDPILQNFVPLPEKRRIIGGSTAGELLGLGVWVEYGYNKMENRTNFYELVLGSDYTFDFQTYVMLEYYRNMQGKSDYNQYTLNDWMRFMTNEQKALSRDQIYCLIQHPVTDLIYLGFSTVFSISDKSLILIPTINYNIFENVELLGYFNFYLGREGTAYADNMGNGGLIRAVVYF